MTDRPRISDAEWEVMTVLWDRHPLTSGEVADALAGRTGWHPKTVRTLLGRLVQKGYLAYQPEGTRYHYSPAVPREECVREESRSFVERVFGGDAQSLLAHFVRSAELSSEEIAELRRLLDHKEGAE